MRAGVHHRQGPPRPYAHRQPLRLEAPAEAGYRVTILTNQHQVVHPLQGFLGDALASVVPALRHALRFLGHPIDSQDPDGDALVQFGGEVLPAGEGSFDS